MGKRRIPVFILSFVIRWRLVVVYKSLLDFRAEGAPSGTHSVDMVGPKHGLTL